jgi:hypothetical protein
MKRIQHIAVRSIAGISILALCSAGMFPTQREQLRQVVEQEVPEQDLPSRINSAFKEGEVLTYRLHYGFIDAGVAILEVKPEVLDVSGRKVYHMVGNGYSKGSFDWFFKVRDRYESFVDKDALLPWMFVRRVDEGGYKINQDYTFNHYLNKVDIGGGQKYDIPAGTQDMISSFYAARNLDFSTAKEGDIFTIQSFVDKEVWPLKIRYVGKETIETDLGKYRCLKFRPIVQKGRIFKKEEDLNVWITDDKNHVPLRAQAKILVGSIKLDIVSWQNLANTTAIVK